MTAQDRSESTESPGAGQAWRQSLGRGLEALIDEGMAAGLFRGACLRIEFFPAPSSSAPALPPVLEVYRGTAALEDGREIPFAPSLRFDAASVSKIFTTTALLRLVSLGRLSLSDRPAEILGLRDPAFETLSGLPLSAYLDHSTGLHYWHPFYAQPGKAFEAILASVLSTHPLKREVIYSDLNFMILGKVLESVTGAPIREAMRALVFEPLGLKSSGYGPIPARDAVASELGNRIEEGMVAELGLSFTGWRPRDIAIRGEGDDGNAFYYFKGAAGHAGVFTAPRDLAALGAVYLKGLLRASAGETEHSDVAPLYARPSRPPQSLEALDYLDPTLIRAVPRPRPGDRGLGFQLGDNYPGGGFGHTGFTGSYLHINPAAGFIVAGHANRLFVERPLRIPEFWKAVSLAALEYRTVPPT